MTTATINEKDPFSQVYDLLKQLLRNNSTIKQLVATKNLCLFMGDGQKPMAALKREITEGDLPELRILPMGGTPHIGRDSDHSTFLQKFDIQLATGSLDATALLFPLTLALFAAWASWHPMFATLTWRGLPFVHTAIATEASQGIAIENENRGIRGWASVWSVQTDIWIPTVLLRELNITQ